MKRAVIIIGVRKAHVLPTLQAVDAGVQGMREWAQSQGIHTDLIKSITDATAKVTPQQIKDAVKEFSDRGDLDQLIIYFAGHGVNLQYGEYWLLSDAIADPDAAVNVRGSEERARFGTIPHVAFLSDACRTAPSGIAAQGITGSIIFPNPSVPGPEKSVDLFYATLLGQPALEIADPNDAAAKFHAVYTEVLLEALNGRHSGVMSPGSEDGVQIIRPRPLKQFLANELPIRVFNATRGSNPRSQQPDARITSDDSVWLSEFKGSPRPLAPDAATPAREHAEFAQTVMARPEEATRAVIRGRDIRIAAAPAAERHEAGRADLDVFSGQNKLFFESSVANAAPFGPPHFESGCGFKVRGAQVVAHQANRANVELLNETVVRIWLQNTRCASVLLTFQNGRGALLPAIEGFLAALTFDGDQLVDVAYEPSDTSDRWPNYQARAEELRSLRSAIAAASRLGVFRLEGPDAEDLAQRMQYAKGIDPSLALYAAHAYREQGNRHRIRDMAGYMRADLGIVFFDIALLASGMSGTFDPQRDPTIFPFLPMLSQSWALLQAHEVSLPPTLTGVSRHVSPDSLWTLFDAEGVRLITQSIQEGSVR
jgi:hypothetical protein